MHMRKFINGVTSRHKLVLIVDEGNVSKMPLHSKVKADDFMGRETTNCQNCCTDEYNHMGQASVNKVGPYFSHRGAIKMENVKRAVMMNLGSN